MSGEQTQQQQQLDVQIGKFAKHENWQDTRRKSRVRQKAN